jgi:2Fe-2S ferredoxin
VNVTFILDGEPKTFAIDLATLSYQRHGVPASLLDVALNVGVPLEHVCGGNCACTTCHVIIRSGMEHLSEMDDNEADRLDTAWDLTPASRLACQAVVKGDVTCEIPAYTRNYVEEGGGIRLGAARR